MPVTLAFENGVQVVAIDGSLSPSEDVSVRQKLKEKLALGRKLFHFKLNQVTRGLDAHLRVLELLKSITDEFTQIAITGEVEAIPIESRHARLQVFNSDEEALRWLIAEKQDPEEDHRRQHVRELLRSYEVHQSPTQLDPFRLAALNEAYQKNPSREIILELDRSLRELESKHHHLLELNLQADQLSGAAAEILGLRKFPMKEVEVSTWEARMQQERSALVRQKDSLKVEIAARKAQVTALQLASVRLQESRQGQIQSAERDLFENEKRLAQLQMQAHESNIYGLAEIAELQKELDLLLDHQGGSKA